MVVSAKETQNLRFLLIFAFLSLIPIKTICNSSNDPIVLELLTLQSQSDSGIIRLSEDLLHRILSSSNRPFSLFVFFDAQELHSKPELRLQTLKSSFSIVATSFVANNKDTPALSKLFFCDVELQESKSIFAKFVVHALPHIRLVPPSARNLKSDTLQMSGGDFSRLAESMSEFIESRTKLSVGPLFRPPCISSKVLFISIAVILIWSPFLSKRVIAGKTFLHDRKTWLSGAIFVYFFSVAGTMHNIIRKMPIFWGDTKDPSMLVFFYKGSGIQLGAEGFAVGFLYTIVGLMLALMTHVVVRVRSARMQRLVMILALFFSFWAAHEVVSLNNWKTGYSIHPYWPSSWD